jgi:hypothetical protein
MEDWKREHFVPSGGDPFLFYVAFGEIDAAAPLSASRYRSNGAPDEIELMSYDRNSQPDVFEMFMQGYVWDRLRIDDPGLASEVESAPGCVVLRGAVPDPPTLNYLRDCVGLLTHFFDNGARALYDPLTLHWWNREQWNEWIFSPAASVPRHHVVILLSPEEGNRTTWVHTRGMLKFGRPDISVRGVDESALDGAIDLCNRFIELQAFGGVVPEGQEIRMASLPPGGRVHHTGSLDDPEFNNVHVEIVWPWRGES